MKNLIFLSITFICLLLLCFHSIYNTNTLFNTYCFSKSCYTHSNLNYNEIPVLCYHSVNPNSTNEAIITPSLLKEHLLYIKDCGYTTLSLSKFYDNILHNSQVPEKSILITFDDGYMDNYYYAFPILKELNMTATIFCITNSLDGKYYLSQAAIKSMCDYGIDIGCHTFSHPKLSSLSLDSQISEIENSKNSLEKITNKKITAIAYPFGNYDKNTILAAKHCGYTMAFTTNNGFAKYSNDVYKLNRICIGSQCSVKHLKLLLNEKKNAI